MGKQVKLKWSVWGTFSLLAIVVQWRRAQSELNSPGYVAVMELEYSTNREFVNAKKIYETLPAD